MTALAVAMGYRYRGLPGTVVVLLWMILPSFALTLLPIAYPLLSNSAAFHVLNLTLMPAALAIVIVSAFGLGREYLRPSIELALMLGGAASVLIFGWNPALVVLLAGGANGGFAIRDAYEASA